MECEVNLEEVKAFITGEAFTSFLLDNTTDFSIAAYVLQTLLNNIDKDMEN